MDRTEKLWDATLDLTFSGDEIVLDWRNNTAQLNEKGVAKLLRIFKEHGGVFKADGEVTPELLGKLHMLMVEELDLKEKE
jgi:hypothetical protein